MEVTKAPAGRKRDHEKLFIVDTDVHHGSESWSDLYPYLSQVYAERLRDHGGSGPSSQYWHNGGDRGRRADFLDRDDPLESTRRQLLDDCEIDIAILTGSTANGACRMPDVDLGSAICCAFNDYTLEHWVASDARFRVAMAVNTQDPFGMAKEIDRIGSHPAVIAIIMPGGATKPYGNRVYDPIYEACERNRLAVMIHFSGEGVGINGPPTAAGWPTHYVEGRMMRAPIYMAHMASFIFEGTFEKFPGLRIVNVEAGFAWMPWYLWRMDSDWKALRYQVPWVKKPPSEYVKEHVRVNTQPIDEPENERDLEQIIEWMHGDQTLLFGSDYPHFDFDDPRKTLTRLPDKLRRRIFGESAIETFPKLQPVD
ncbi:MAG: amidohydrolase family protein [Gammaproteobacteria bacterium]|nr:amidohydrolase family protein [Gammaproteobacteria bacterium]